MRRLVLPLEDEASLHCLVLVREDEVSPCSRAGRRTVLTGSGPSVYRFPVGPVCTARIRRAVEDFRDWTNWLFYRGGIGVKGEESWEAWWDEELVR
ncbi:hypothetical protein BHE74_00036057 [Ensete ventricosum]|uniref:Uncharacterized protein n=1 Tax=Ensete ventricosum TaxID=4639 RepID=A0A426YH50_ENSVE|nr:hypothetical protein B296_00051367 [Ensete ventricosum]RWW57168.1 hypothetical protein BHE74_00036057 [Ensete ventricosum]RZS17151.1 hypothetical protein BHM03_00049268 [Ensete ventricosum]